VNKFKFDLIYKFQFQELVLLTFEAGVVECVFDKVPGADALLAPNQAALAARVGVERSALGVVLALLQQTSGAFIRNNLKFVSRLR